MTQNNDDYLLKPKEINEPSNKSKTLKEPIHAHSELDSLPKIKMMELFKKLTVKDALLVKEDEAIIDSIPSPIEENSLLEALLVVGYLHKAARPTALPKDQLKEKDLDASASSKPEQADVKTLALKNPRSLSSLFEERGMDILKILENNPFLSGVSVAFLALKASEQTSNTIAFDGKIKEIFTNRTEALAQLSPGAPTENPSSAEEKAEKDIPKPALLEAPPKVEANASEKNTPAVQENLSVDHLFLKAEEMIEDEKYKEAISFLEQVPKDHASFSKAQSKIKEAANLAVQKLRQKAARSFQAANPVHDQKARKAYLLEAKKYLEEAIESFQDSEKLETVKQNLEVIKRQLENLDDGLR